MFNSDKIVTAQPSQGKVKGVVNIGVGKYGNNESSKNKGKNKGKNGRVKKKRRLRWLAYRAKDMIKEKKYLERQETQAVTPLAPQVDTEKEELKKEVEKLREELERVKSSRSYLEKRVKLLNEDLERTLIQVNNDERREIIDYIGGMVIRTNSIGTEIRKERRDGMEPERTEMIRAEHLELSKELRNMPGAARLTRVQRQREEERASSLEKEAIQTKREVSGQVESLGKSYMEDTANCVRLLGGNKGEVMEAQQILLRETLKIGPALNKIWKALVELNQLHILASIPRGWDRLMMAEGKSTKFLHHLLSKIDGTPNNDPRKRELKSQYSTVMAREGIRGFLHQIQS